MTTAEMSFEFLKIIVSICSALITLWLLPYLDDLRKNKRYGVVIDMIAVAVRAAEQTITDPKSGAVKKEKVINFIKFWLNKQGIDISDEEIGELIESAVYQMKQKEKADEQ